MQPERLASRNRLLAEQGFAAEQLQPLAADASFRSYERLRHPDGRRAVLMNAPPGKEDVRPFNRIAGLLAEWGLSAPTVIAADADAGFLLLEDLGDDLFSALIRDGFDEARLYRAAIDVLVNIADRTPPADLPAYDMDLLRFETDLVLDWRYRAVRGHAPTDNLRQAWHAAWRVCLEPVANTQSTLVLRDYHVDNLIWLPDRPSVRSVGLLDFQDAVRGHPAYDLASLLSDVRRDVPPAIEQAMLDHYAVATGCDHATLKRDYTILAAQRNAKILGIFTRLSQRDGKHAYLDLLPRTWRLLRRDLAHPALAPVAAWFDNHLHDDPAAQS